MNSKKWGVYAKSKKAAKTLAYILGYYYAPKVHSSGYYGHYHDSKHIIHIWFGERLYY